ncbi:hypothetical protein HDV04_003929 [Boothiomyces sp. JEL0838]|nr:hypothetical protein HDV04_003928 [Boothiomyces sp. JEL0838]KAJ3311551.1 hypothetical protein HDV04_003929 [Boothiomyces sp. JEL0838]
MDYRYLEIVGLHEGSFGRTCISHAYCGKSLKVGDLLILEKTTIKYHEILEEEVEIHVEPQVKKRGRPKKPNIQKIQKEIEVIEPSFIAIKLEDSIKKCTVGFLLWRSSRGYSGENYRSLCGRQVRV